MVERRDGTCFKGQGTFQRLVGKPTHLHEQGMELDSEILLFSIYQLHPLNKAFELLNLSGLVGKQ